MSAAALLVAAGIAYIGAESADRVTRGLLTVAVLAALAAAVVSA